MIDHWSKLVIADPFTIFDSNEVTETTDYNHLHSLYNSDYNQLNAIVIQRKYNECKWL